MNKHVSLIFGLLIGMLGAARTQAQSTLESDARAGALHGQNTEGLASNGLCGLAYTAYPTCPERISAAASAGYGYTESMGPVSGAHHRMAGTLGVGVVPLPWLAVALRLDCRLDMHPRDSQGKDVTGTGDPRLFLRGGHALTRRLSLGGEAVIWVPGNKAPSFKANATTVDLKALVAHRLSALSLTLLGYAGARIDQSAKSAPDLARLRPGDRSALGLSDSDAVLLGIGASTRALAQSELFAEVAVDWLVGSKAPALSKSPMRATVGGRYFFKHALQGELTATIGLSGRPSLDPSAPLVPIEPRFMLGAGLRYGHALHAPPPPKPVTPAAPAEVEAPRDAKLEGVLVDSAGAALPDVNVTLHAGDRRETAITDGAGHYAFERVPLGTAELEATASGFETQTWSVEVVPHNPPLEQRALVQKGNLGTLRVVTRTFASEPLAAAIVVRDAKGKKVTSGQAGTNGLFEFELPPGRYLVMISAPGYRPHQREIQIERYGVAIMNVDMRASHE